MNASNFSRFPTKSQRKGILWTFALFLVAHLVVYFLPYDNNKHEQGLVLDVSTQQQLDSIWLSSPKQTRDTIYPFNPNYITDFKAYQLEVPIAAVARIRTFVSQGNYIDSEALFRQVTQLSDSQVHRLRPYLKIPKKLKRSVDKKKKRVKIELNAATPAQLTKVYGVGEVFANRIVALRKALGGFLVPDQLADVWGLPVETQERLWDFFSLDSVPQIEKQNINQLTIDELSKMHYITPALASSLVAVRTQKGTLSSWHDLAHIQQLDSVKKARLSLYLSFE